MGVYKWILISIISPISLISTLAFPSDSLAPDYAKQTTETHMTTESIITLTDDDQQNNKELIDTAHEKATSNNDKQKNSNLHSMENVTSLPHNDGQNGTLFNDKEGSITPIHNDESPKLISKVQNVMVTTLHGVQNSINQALNDIQNKDSMDNSDDDGTIRGNGWNEERPSVESNEIWRRYYSMEK